jgi:hypothetical protein
MKGNFPSRYVKDHFPITHQIKFLQELEGRVIRGNAHKSAEKVTTLAMEAIMAVLLCGKLGDDTISLSSGHCFNDDICGYRKRCGHNGHVYGGR